MGMDEDEDEDDCDVFQMAEMSELADRRPAAKETMDNNLIVPVITDCILGRSSLVKSFEWEINNNNNNNVRD